MSESGFTVSQAAQILCLSRQQVLNLLATDLLAAIPGTSPRRVTRESVVSECTKRLSTTEQLLAGLRAGARQAGVTSDEHGGDPTPTDGTQEARELRRLMEQERIGRAVAEARIDELRQHLRRANAAIAALTPEPDPDLDALDG